MTAFSESEIQVLIALLELADPVETPNNIGYDFYPQTLEEAARYFRRSRLSWDRAYQCLVEAGLLVQIGEVTQLTEAGKAAARELRRARPPLYYWYCDYYAARPTSRAHARFCERLYGRDLAQAGFADMAQIDQLVDLMQLRPGDRVLDLGCGDGRIAEYVSDRTGAIVTGIDYIPEAIRQAEARTRDKRARLAFCEGNLDELAFAERSFDWALSIDTLYMPNNLAETIHRLAQIVGEQGHMAILYSYALWGAPGADRITLQAEHTPLADALQANGLAFRAMDLTEADLRLALRKQQLAEDMRNEFLIEGNDFIVDLLQGEAEGVRQAIQANAAVRYLYIVGSG